MGSLKRTYKIVTPLMDDSTGVPTIRLRSMEIISGVHVADKVTFSLIVGRKDIYGLKRKDIFAIRSSCNDALKALEEYEARGPHE